MPRKNIFKNSISQSIKQAPLEICNIYNMYWYKQESMVTENVYFRNQSFDMRTVSDWPATC